jgi:hypothetical protein
VVRDGGVHCTYIGQDVEEVGVAEYPASLCTDSLGPCIGIGVIDFDSGKRYLVHYSSFRHLSNEFFAILGGCSKNVTIAVAGGDISGDSPEPYEDQPISVMSEEGDMESEEEYHGEGTDVQSERDFVTREL